MPIHRPAARRVVADIQAADKALAALEDATNTALADLPSEAEYIVLTDLAASVNVVRAALADLNRTAAALWPS